MKTLPVILILSLTVLSVLPITLPRVHAVSSNGNNYWSAFGPRVDNLLYTVYTDFTGMFTAFTSGSLDITDWPIQAGDLAGFLGNPDFFVTSRQGDFGIFQLDINHQDPFLTVAWQVARTASGPGTTPATIGSPLFAPGTPSLTITSTCAIPCLGFSLVSDSHIKFIDSPPAKTPNAPGTWAPGKAVVYDVDGDGVYNAFGTPPDTVISGSGLAPETNLSIDPLIKYVDDFPTEGIWNLGEAVAYDANGNGIFDSGEALIAGPSGHFNLLVHLKNIEEGGALVKDVNNLVTATITSAPTPTATKADDTNPTPSGIYGGPWGIGLTSLPASFVISTTIYSGSVTLFTSGTTAPVCPTGQQCSADLSVNYNSPSTQKPSVAGIETSRALSHLVDKPSFLTGPYLTPPGATPLADCDDVQAPPAQSLMISVGAGACNHNSSPDLATMNADCAEHTWLSPCSPVSLYNLSPDSITGAASCAAGTLGISCFPSQSATPPIGYSGTNDLRAACDHFVAAGFTLSSVTSPNGAVTTTANCLQVAQGAAITACNPGTTTCNSITAHIVNPTGSCNTSTGVGCIIMYIRTHPPRTAFGTIIADELNFLFGTPAPTGGTVCYGGPPSFTCSLTPVYFSISQIASIVFSVSTVADWNLYTGGFFLGSTPDHLFALYHSQFASNLCGGSSSTFPNNYPLYCDPVYDTQANAGENVPGLTFSAFLQTAILGATRGSTVAIYSGENQFVALNAWNFQQVGAGTGSSLVAVKGHGFEASSGAQVTLNMRPVPGYVPSNSLFYASGCNPSTGCQQNTIRRSMAQTTLHMSPYVATTVWEFEPLVQIYDSMLAVDPNTGGLCQTQPGGTAHCIDWMTTSHSTSFDATTGKSTQTWNLRSDIFWHDGQAVTAHDVCFTILSYKAAPSANFLPSVSNVVSCTVVSNKIVQVVLTGQSSFNELNIGGLLIIPEHVWAPICGGLVAGTDSCVTPTALANPSFDPVAAGDMVGSGPWVCNPSVGVSTISGQASCTQNANGSAGGQALGAAARILLKRDLGYMRCCSSIQASENGLSTTNLQALEWADFNKDGKITILDIAAAAIKFGTYDPYFASPMYGTTVFDPTKPNGGLVVDIGDIATMAFFLDHGLTAPLLGAPKGYLSATPGGLTQLDPLTDPYDLTVSGVQNWDYGNGAPGNWAKGNSGTVSVSGLALILQSNMGIPAGASYTALMTSAPAGAPLNPCTVGTGTFSDGTLGPQTLSFASGTSAPTPLPFNFGHCFPSGTYVFQVSYTPPGGSATTVWTLTVVKP